MDVFLEFVVYKTIPLSSHLIFDLQNHIIRQR